MLKWILFNITVYVNKKRVRNQITYNDWCTIKANQTKTIIIRSYQEPYCRMKIVCIWLEFCIAMIQLYVYIYMQKHNQQ